MVPIIGGIKPAGGIGIGPIGIPPKGGLILLLWGRLIGGIGIGIGIDIGIDIGIEENGIPPNINGLNC